VVVVAAVALAAAAPADARDLDRVGGAATVLTVASGEPRPACGTEHPRAAVPPRPAVPRSSVRYASYNFLHALGTSNSSLDARVPLIVDAIAAAGADVVGAQEVEELGSRGFTTARVARGLVAKTGSAWHWCFFAANPVVPGEADSLVGGGGPQSIAIQPIASGALGETVFRTGVGILSRYPIVASGAERLPYRVAEDVNACPDLPCRLAATFESRAAVRAVVATPAGRVHVVSTHLAHTVTARSDLSRVAQNAAMLEWIETFSAAAPYPVVLTGDFNSVEGSRVHAAVLAAGFVDTFRVAHPTASGFTSSQEIGAPGPTVTSRIDYVFARGAACALPRAGRARSPRVVSSDVFGDEPGLVGGAPLWPSDHYGVVTSLRTRPSACTGLRR
jgi:endonuclease/exonuclease/phosphatase family metal-dependent hydrolase